MTVCSRPFELHWIPKLISDITLCVTELCTEKYESLLKYLKKYIDSESDFGKFYDEDEDSDLEEENEGSVSGNYQADENFFSGDDDDAVENDLDSQPGSSEAIVKPVEEDLDVPKDNFEEYWGTVRLRVEKLFKKTKNVVKRHVQQAITSQLMYGVEKDLADVLFEPLYRGNDKVDDLMRESESLLRERASTEETLGIYQELKRIVDDFLESATM